MGIVEQEFSKKPSQKKKKVKVENKT